MTLRIRRSGWPSPVLAVNCKCPSYAFLAGFARLTADRSAGWSGSPHRRVDLPPERRPRSPRAGMHHISEAARRHASSSVPKGAHTVSIGTAAAEEQSCRSLANIRSVTTAAFEVSLVPDEHGSNGYFYSAFCLRFGVVSRTMALPPPSPRGQADTGSAAGKTSAESRCCCPVVAETVRAASRPAARAQGVGASPSHPITRNPR